MAIITISRELGAGAAVIAAGVAQQLHWRLVDRDVLHAIARITGVDDIWLDASDERWPIRESLLDGRMYLSALYAAVRELTAVGNWVILGRGASIILRDEPAALHVRIVAPRRHRIERVRAQMPMSAETAAELIRESDRSRAAFYQHFFHVDWADPCAYHLVVNTGRAPIPEAVSLIVDAARRGGLG